MVKRRVLQMISVDEPIVDPTKYPGTLQSIQWPRSVTIFLTAAGTQPNPSFLSLCPPVGPFYHRLNLPSLIGSLTRFSPQKGCVSGALMNGVAARSWDPKEGKEGGKATIDLNNRQRVKKGFLET